MTFLQSREGLRHLHVVTEAIVDGVCRATTKRAERADLHLQIRNSLLGLLESLFDEALDRFQRAAAAAARAERLADDEELVRGLGKALADVDNASCEDDA